MTPDNSGLFLMRAGGSLATPADPVQINAVKMTGYVPVALDADGTPLSHGEPMTEVEPGIWGDPVIAAAVDFLEAAAGDLDQPG